MKGKVFLATIIAIFVLAIGSVQAQTSSFTYQGRLAEAAVAANGTYQMQFTLFDALGGGTQQGSTITNNTVTVTNGVFTVQLDFTAAPFATGADRFIEINVKKPADAGFTTLTPRQPITSTPYAVRSQSAAGADNAAQLGGVAASQYVQTADSRLTDARNPTAGSANYIQNTTTQQPANFNITGNGTAGAFIGNLVVATTQYNLGGARILSNGGTFNLFAGEGTGIFNTTGGNNAFVGAFAGQGNSTGSQNAFVGALAGVSNSTGAFNTFIGRQAGANVTTGSSNVFIGNDTGLNNSSGGSNTLIGAGANVASNGLSFATAIGAGATVSASNSITLGRSNAADRVIVPGGLSLNGNTLFLRGNNDNSSTIVSTPTEVGFNSPNRFSWSVPFGGGTRMVLESNGNLSLAGVLFINSDARYKTNIQTYAGGLDAVMRLRGVTYNWKPELQRDPRPQIGFIAQEVEAVLPELVSTDEQGFKSVAYANAVPVLVEAIKEQQQQLAKQQRQIEELKEQLAALAARLPQPKAADHR